MSDFRSYIPIFSGLDTQFQERRQETGAITAIADGIAVLSVGGKAATVTATFSRPADTIAYAVGDLIANSTTAGSVTPMALAVARVADGTGMVRRLRLKTSDTAFAGASIRVHLYKNSPTIANGDNGAWSTSESNYLGATDITLDKTFTDGVKGIGAPNTGSEINFEPAIETQNIYALLETRSAVTPGSAKTWTLTAEVLQN